jgi:hypothetical protein
MFSVLDLLLPYSTIVQEIQFKKVAKSPPFTYNQTFFVSSKIQQTWQIEDTVNNSSFFAFTQISFVDPDPVDP